MIALHLKTTNDTNGNPRRLYVFLTDTGQVCGVRDEGSKGYGARDEWAREHANGAAVFEGPEIVITPGEYREWLRWTP
jgi:hypothetical protein